LQFRGILHGVLFTRNSVVGNLLSRCPLCYLHPCCCWYSVLLLLLQLLLVPLPNFLLWVTFLLLPTPLLVASAAKPIFWLWVAFLLLLCPCCCCVLLLLRPCRLLRPCCCWRLCSCYGFLLLLASLFLLAILLLHIAGIPFCCRHLRPFSLLHVICCLWGIIKKQFKNLTLKVKPLWNRCITSHGIPQNLGKQNFA
jgi:hypothetical protein